MNSTRAVEISIQAESAAFMSVSYGLRLASPGITRPRRSTVRVLRTAACPAGRAPAALSDRQQELREWSTEDPERLPGLKFMRTLWVCDIAGGPQHYAVTKPGDTPLGLEEAHRALKISPAIFDEAAAELARSLDHFNVPDPPQHAALSPFSTHH